MEDYNQLNPNTEPTDNDDDHSTADKKSEIQPPVRQSNRLYAILAINLFNVFNVSYKVILKL